MPNPAKSIVMTPGAARTTNGTAGDVITVEGYTAAIIMLDVKTVTGTSPTLNVYVQHRVPTDQGGTNIGDFATGAAINHDFVAFTQVTASNTRRIAIIVGSGNLESAAQDKALAAGSIRNGPIGWKWQVAWTIGGTNPNFNFNVVAVLIP